MYYVVPQDTCSVIPVDMYRGKSLLLWTEISLGPNADMLFYSVTEQERRTSEDKVSVSAELGKNDTNLVLTKEQAHHLKTTATLHYGLTKKDCRVLTFQHAEVKFPERWKVGNAAGKGWLRGFMKRFPALSLRKPEATSVTRCKSFNKDNGHPPPPPLQGTIGGANPSGWTNENLFLQYLDHFIRHAKPSELNPVLQNAEIMLDRTVFGPYKTYYNNAVSEWMFTNPGKPLSIYGEAKIFGKAYLLAFASHNIFKGF
ncbi:hypothetical protein PR048_025086 [Dryococelus australis]|uniref:Uncharacterized protein n=1 Tax=Dryococelus australis TaxID=614101 RepID=A0ABQ9GQF5_9NEOP|nr:hypothetical protein PR048_025086 [Dryococelus australis]